MNHEPLATCRLFAAALVATLLAASGIAEASVIVTSRAGLAPGDFELSAPGPDFTVFPNPLVQAYPGGSASFNGPAGSLERLTQGPSWAGNFAPGDPLYFTNFEPGAIDLFFSTGVLEVGTQYQSNFGGAFIATIATFDASNALIGTFSLPGVSDGSSNDSAVFLGIRNTLGENAIRRVRFSTTNDDEGFSINQVTFGASAAPPGTVPEPASLALVGVALGACGLVRRRRKS